MASKMLVIIAVLVVVPPSATMAAEYVVGDDAGWTVNFDYQAWAMGKVFSVGDTLVFNYTVGKHNVFKVDKNGFDNCIAPPENEALTSGHDVITLKTPGKKWYICGVEGHCSKLNQKLVINVEAAAPTPAPQPATDSAYGILACGYHVFMAAVVALGLLVMA